MLWFYTLLCLVHDILVIKYNEHKCLEDNIGHILFTFLFCTAKKVILFAFGNLFMQQRLFGFRNFQTLRIYGRQELGFGNCSSVYLNDDW